MNTVFEFAFISTYLSISSPQKITYHIFASVNSSDNLQNIARNVPLNQNTSDCKNPVCIPTTFFIDQPVHTCRQMNFFLNLQITNISMSLALTILLALGLKIQI